MASTDAGSTRARGRAVEQAVAEHLRAHGLEIIEANFAGAGAELDLVAREYAPNGAVTYVFVEVRSRACTEHGTALETIDRHKQRRVIRAATTWLVAKGLWERVEVRFDAVGVDPQSSAPTWIRNAFEADG
ncbi:YraN family protein [Paraliomyxa miuraensis]|uniref:YraN family protein n=1 Tax=Paraliomyxa miuraensis TaxID=376150 RepID=UPI002250420C|nr:YraN family protein [Paraliomyxa miuraensis]MCX4239213.1 YraN family protein [Paraliomyxa miuraensis]